MEDVEKAVGNDSKGKPLSKRAAERMLEQLQDSVDTGTFKPTTATVHDLGLRWLKEHVQANLKPSTAANYRDTFHTHISPALGAYRVDAVTDEMISSLLERKLAQGLSRQTVQKIHRHAHAMFAFAIRNKLLAANPAATGSRPRIGAVRGVARRSRPPRPNGSSTPALHAGDSSSASRCPRACDEARWSDCAGVT